MTILDANVLIYAYDSRAAEHGRVRAWLERRFSGDEQLGIPWVSLWAFLRITTNPRVNPQPAPGPAFEIVRQLLAAPRVVVVEPGRRHAELLERLAEEQGAATGRSLTHAVLAALAIEHGATLASTDRDFARFPGLRWVNPLDN